MSIRDDDGREILQLSKIWAWSFKLLMIMAPFVAVTLFSWGTWVTISIFEHSAQFQILQDRHSRGGGGNISGASINVGSAEDVAESGREYLTVQEVAEREGKAERTIIEWIETGRIHPPPSKAGREWCVAAEYRVLPQVAADSGGEP